MQDIPLKTTTQKEVAQIQDPTATIIKQKPSLSFGKKIIIFLSVIILFLLILIGLMRDRSTTPLPNDDFLNTSLTTSQGDSIDYSTSSEYSNSTNFSDSPGNYSLDYSNSSSDRPNNPPTLLPSSSPSPPINSPDLPSSNSSTRPATSPNTPTY